MKYRWAVMVCAFVLVCGVGGEARADVGDYPDVYAFYGPIGAAAETMPIYPRFWIGDYGVNPDPSEWAREAYQAVLESGQTDHVWIDFVNFALGSPNPNAAGVALAYHPGDALIIPDPDDPNFIPDACPSFDPNDPNFLFRPSYCALLEVADQEYWKTPWYEHGINAPEPNDPNTELWGLKAWMQTFVNEYEQYRLYGDPSDPNIVSGAPAPHRFHFDNEIQTLHRPLPVTSPTHETVSVPLLFHALRECPSGRWGDPDHPNVGEKLPGHDKTLAVLWKEFWQDVVANDPECDSEEDVFPDRDAGYRTGDKNKRWYEWWYGISSEALDGAMKEAAYDVIHATWSNCKCSNYETSARLDGVGENNIWDSDSGIDGFAWEGSGDFQTPVLYPVTPVIAYRILSWEMGYASPDPNDYEQYVAANLWLFRHDLEACINSFSGQYADAITPWINMPGAPVGALENLDQNGSYDGSRRLLALLRSKQIDEFILYQSSSTVDPNGADWTQFVDLLHQVWDSDLYDLRRIYGQFGTFVQADAEYSDDVFVEVNSNYDSGLGKYKVIIQAKFETDYCDGGCPDALRTFVETAVSNATSDVTVEFTMYDFDDAGAFETIGSSITLANGERENTYWDVAANADDYINDSNNRVKFQLTYTSNNSFTARLDFALVVENDD